MLRISGADSACRWSVMCASGRRCVFSATAIDVSSVCLTKHSESLTDDAWVDVECVTVVAIVAVVLPVALLRDDG